ncbi:hypothetical protein FB45DRAFT_915832 [Roridomyces roridus]|uniref:Secreted protein n=1 Tax=Roridomyces roridus TaxID=1738132 RepID=A0AAD7BTR6_9AGAR|nr:hypothetical protein FB45DRAFT_915832 [Roridomyces roridus]
MPGVTVFKLFFILFAGFTVALPFSTTFPSPTQAGQGSESTHAPETRQDAYARRDQPAPADTTTSIFAQDQWEDRKRRNNDPSFPRATALPRDVKFVLDVPQYQQWERREVDSDSDVVRRNNSNSSFFAKIQWEESD